MTLTNKANLGAPVQGLDLPPIDGMDHLVEQLFEVGPSAHGDVLTFSELESWSRMTGVVLSPWEAATLRRMSGAYLFEQQEAKDPTRKAPYLPMRDEED